MTTGLATGGRLHTRLIRGVGLLVSLGALWLVLHSVDLGASVKLLAGANLVPIVAGLVVIATQVVLRSIRWRLLLPSPPSGGRIQIRRIVPVLLVGYLGNAVLPARLGEPIRAYLVARREELDPAESFGSVVLERIVDTATLAIVAFAAAVALDAPSWIVQSTALVALAATALTAGLIVVGLGPLVRRLRRLLSHFPGSARVEPVLARLDDFARGVDRPSRSRALLTAVLISAACWMLDATTFWLAGRAIGVSMSPAAALIVAAVTVLGTALPSAPGYIGTFELAAATTAGALGVSAVPALALAVLAHALAVLPVAAAGAVSLAAMNAGLGRLASEAASADHSAGATVTPL
jgi:uncharacterized protein (TIRG00374 family)